MRAVTILLAIASLSACHSSSRDVAGPAKPAALTFDGATGDAAAIRAHGERLSHILGCRGCHGPKLEGHWFNDDTPDLGKLYASNLTRVLPTMTDAQLKHLLRDGVHPTRGDLWIMPSEVFQRLSKPDMDALIAHLRTVRPSGAPTPPPALSAKAMIAGGKLHPVAFYVAEFKAKTPPELGPKQALAATSRRRHAPNVMAPTSPVFPTSGRACRPPTSTLRGPIPTPNWLNCCRPGKGAPRATSG